MAIEKQTQDGQTKFENALIANGFILVRYAIGVNTVSIFSDGLGNSVIMEEFRTKEGKQNGFDVYFKSNRSIEEDIKTLSKIKA